MRRLVAPVLVGIALFHLSALAEPRVQDAVPLAEDLGPQSIYERALRNLMESAILDLHLVSVDAGGHEQRFEVEMMWRRYLEGTQEAAEGILSRALARYLEPRDLRKAGVLLVNRLDGADEQFVYLHSSRRVRRLNLRGQNVFGTDFAVEDLIPRGLSQASYRRLPDSEVGGVQCYVVEALFEEQVEARYSRGHFYIEKEHFVPVLVRYWNRAGVEAKQLRVPMDQIREIGGLHVPIAMTIHSLLRNSHTELRVATLVPNPDLPESYFSVRNLEQHATAGIPRRYYQGAHEFD